MWSVFGTSLPSNMSHSTVLCFSVLNLGDLSEEQTSGFHLDRILLPI